MSVYHLCGVPAKARKVIEFLGSGVTDGFRTARPLLHRETLSQRTKTNKKLRIVKWGASRRGWRKETNQNALSEKKSIFNTNKKPKTIISMDPFGAAHIYILYGYVAIIWSIVSLCKPISLKQSDSPTPSSHQLSIALQIGMGLLKLLPHPC